MTRYSFDGDANDVSGNGNNGTSTEAQSGVHDGLLRVLEAEVFPDTSDNVTYYEGIFDSTDE